MTRERAGVGFYEPGLDVLRFAAFLMVFVSHAFPDWAWQVAYPSVAAHWRATVIQAGAFGVDVFFALSAFLLTTLLRREQRERGRIGIRAFYIRRALRIWPLYYTFLIGYLIIAHVFPRPALPPLPPGYRLGFFLFYGNWLCALHGYSHTCIDILWSVSVEEQFYVLWPLVLQGYGGRLLGIAGTLAALGVITQGMLVTRWAGHPALWCNTGVRLLPIAVGTAVAWWADGRTFHWSFGERAAMAGSALLALITAARICPTLDGPTSLIAYPLVAAASGLLLIAGLGAVMTSHRLWRGLVYGGKISYGLYVVHLLILNLLARTILGAPFTKAAVGLLITLFIADLSYRLLEQPFLRLKRQFSLHNGLRSNES